MGYSRACAIMALVIGAAFASQPLDAKGTSRKYYEFLKSPGNTWRYAVVRRGPKPGETTRWVEEHEVLTHKRWGRLNFVQISVHFYLAGKSQPNRRFTMSYLTYQNLLYATRGRRKFTMTEGMAWIRTNPPLMQWVIGFKDWSHRKFPKEKYRAGGVKEVSLAVGEFKYVKTFAQTVKAGAIVRKYWVDHRRGILKMTTVAKIGLGQLTVTKTLTRYHVK